MRTVSFVSSVLTTERVLYMLAYIYTTGIQQGIYMQHIRLHTHMYTTRPLFESQPHFNFSSISTHIRSLTNILKNHTHTHTHTHAKREKKKKKQLQALTLPPHQWARVWGEKKKKKKKHPFLRPLIDTKKE